MAAQTLWRAGVLLCLLLASAVCGAAQRPVGAGDERRLPEAANHAAALSPEEQAARDLLQRFKAESTVWQDERRQLAQQHFRAGKAHFDLGAWRPAYDHFRKALELDPGNERAETYMRKAAGLVGLGEGRGSPIDQAIAQRKVLLAARETQLANLLAEARAAYDEGRFAEALGLFVRAKARAQYFASMPDSARLAAEAEKSIADCKAAIERQRNGARQGRARRAVAEAQKLRAQGRKRLLDRRRAQLAQAQSLVDERRYRQALALCDEVLRHDPADPQANDLRRRAAAAARHDAVAGALATREAETRLCLDELTTLMVPQGEIITIPRQRLEELRKRKGEPPFDDQRKPPEPWEARLRGALQRRVSFDFVETPLPDVVSFLGSVADANIVLDGGATRGGTRNVTLRVEDMTLGAALNWICKLVGAAYTLRDEAIFIARPERIPERTVLRIYDITDLTMEIKNFRGRHRALATDTGRGADAASELAREFLGGDEDEAEKPLSGAELISFIRSLVGPGTWQDGERLAAAWEAAGLPETGRPGKGEELVDLVSIVVGGRTFLGVRTKR